VHELLADQDARPAQGRAGRQVVRDPFLLTRLIADDLRLYSSVLGDVRWPGLLGWRDSTGATRPGGRMRIDPTTALRHELKGRAFFCCLRACAHEFGRDPARFLRGAPGVPGQESR